MTSKTRQLRDLLASGEFLYMPSATTPIEGQAGRDRPGPSVVYTGGYATGASRAITEPLLTMDEQVRVAGEVARAVEIPLIADAGAGFGEPLHTMRTVREFAAAGVAGIHIEDQLFPKRAHYHKYVAHAVPLPEFVDKIRWACRQRDRTDRDFVIIARSDTCREFGLDEAVARVNAAAEVGADLGLLFPRNDSEAEAAPKRAKLPLVWVQSRGNRDGRPIYSLAELKAMGYRACIDAQLLLGVAVHFMKEALAEMLRTGRVHRHWRQPVHHPAQGDRGHDRPRHYYEVEAETVEKTETRD